ncbi:hypothetical protein EW093_07800 [Thiospirochaeta perfilievii]|uniref:Uncharacterized protein n=1 Tax=Thiospirochaeta perfilievii TaxID=252967 RepID=A0A5C1QCF9_9SPIO|nr:hypothetical protein [Thiospirochaeta perfilievii]QEN04609.1 hypothetical protein EW093_07800 [Thiospirochaeta perfilievii]
MKKIILVLTTVLTVLVLSSCDVDGSETTKKDDSTLNESQGEVTNVTKISSYISNFTNWEENKDADGSTISIVVESDNLLVSYDISNSTNQYPYSQTMVTAVDTDDTNIPFTDVKTITIAYKSGTDLNIRLNDEGNDGKEYFHTLAASTEFTTVKLNLNTTDFAQPDWATGDRDLILSNVVGVVVYGTDNSGSFELDSISVE